MFVPSVIAKVERVNMIGVAGYELVIDFRRGETGGKLLRQLNKTLTTATTTALADCDCAFIPPPVHIFIPLRCPTRPD